MRILVTGGTGMIGSHLLEQLRCGRDQVLAFGRREHNIIEGVQYDFFDMRDTEKTARRVMAYKPELIFHAAANAAEATGEHSPIDMTSNGYNTFFNVITPAINAGSLEKFIYISTCGVYGNIPTPYVETQRPEPNDIYAVSKYANELSLKILANVYKFKYVIPRLHNVTGERQDLYDMSRNVVTLFMQLMRMGKSPKIFGDGSSTRCYTYAGDVAEMLIGCARLDDLTINIGQDTPTTINELYETIRRISGIEIDAEYHPRRPQDVDINSVDHTLAKSLGIDSTHTFEETVQKTWDWVVKQPLKIPEAKKKEIDLVI